MKEEFTPLNNDIKVKPAFINLQEPTNKIEETKFVKPKEINQIDKINLPSWSIEPPIEIKRGN